MDRIVSTATRILHNISRKTNLSPGRVRRVATITLMVLAVQVLVAGIALSSSAGTPLGRMLSRLLPGGAVSASSHEALLGSIEPAAASPARLLAVGMPPLVSGGHKPLGPSVACTAPHAGIVGWWAAENTAVDVYNDRVGSLINGNTNVPLDMVNNPTFATAFTSGVVGQGFNLAGNDAIRIPFSSAFNTANFSVEGWVNPSNPPAPGNLQVIFGQFHGNVELAIDSAGHIVFGFTDSNGTFQSVTSQGTIPTNSSMFSHVAGVWNGTTLSVYINGVADAHTAAPGTTPVGSACPYMIGGFSPDACGAGPASTSSSFFFGAIDELTFYNTALAQSDINNVFAATSAGKCRVQGLLVGNSGNNTISHFDATTHALLNVLETSTPEIEDMTIGPDGNLYAVGTDVKKFNLATGALIGTFIANGSGGLVSASGITFGPDGNVYLADTNAGGILEYNGTTGAFIGVFATISHAVDLAFGPDGNLYALDSTNGNVDRFNGTTGVRIGTHFITGLGALKATALVFGADENVYISSSNGGGQIDQYSPSGVFIKSFATPTSTVKSPAHARFGPDGNLYVANMNNITSYDAWTGAEIGVFASGSSVNLPFSLVFTGRPVFSPPDLAISVVHGSDFTAGVRSTYQITVSNNGEGATTSPVVVTETLPTGLIFADSNGSDAAWSCSAASQTITCTNTTGIAAGAVSGIQINLVPQVVGTVTNHVSVATTGEFNTSNNTASDVTIIHAPSIVISVPNNPLMYGTQELLTTVVNDFNGNLITTGPASTLSIVFSQNGVGTVGGLNPYTTSGGVGAEQITATNVGMETISADSTLFGNIPVTSGPFAFMVTQKNTITTIMASNTTETQGLPITYTVTVSGGTGLGGTVLIPTGSVSFFEISSTQPPSAGFGTPIGSAPLINGVATFTSNEPSFTDPANQLPAFHRITAVYNADVHFASSHGTVEIKVIAANCTAPPTGMLAWYRAEGNANDSAGLNDGTYVSPGGPATYTVGPNAFVGTAFALNGTDQFITSPGVDAGAGGAISIDAWINHADNNPAPIVEWNTGSLIGTHFWLFPDAGSLFGNLIDTQGNQHQITASNVIFQGQWEHVALTYDKNALDGSNNPGVAVLYVNGVAVATQTLGVFTPQTSSGYNLNIGHRTSSTIGFFNGDIDEVEIFNRALTPADVQNVFNASVAGKCVVSDVSIQKAHVGPSFSIGQTGTYTLTVTNNGTVDTTQVITVTDTLPAEVSYVSATGSGWSCNNSGQTVTCTSDPVAVRLTPLGGFSPARASSSSAITLQVMPNTVTAPGTSSNTATVAMPGDSNSANNSSTDQVVINKGQPVFSNLTPSQSVPFGTSSISVSGNISGGNVPIPSGETITVNILNGSTVVASGTGTTGAPAGALSPFSVTVSGTGALGVANSPYTIQYSYPGDSNFLSATNTSTTLTITKITPVFSNLTASQTITFGTPSITVGGNIMSAVGGMPQDGETVTVTVGGHSGIGTITSGAFSATIATGAIGVSGSPYTITYSYAGDSNLNATSDTSTTLTVNKATPVFSNLTASQTVTYGTPSVTLSGNISNGVVSPNGQIVTIHFTGGPGSPDAPGSATIVNGAFTATVSLVSGGAALLDVSHSPYVITYAYAGDANFNPASDISTSLTVTQATSHVVLNPTPNPQTFGLYVTLTTTVTNGTPGNVGVPTGTITYFDLTAGGGPIGSAPLVNGVASISLNTFTVGAHMLEADYSGDSNFTNGLSQVTENINAAVCVAPPSGLVAWYRAEGDAMDSVGLNDGTYNSPGGPATFTTPPNQFVNEAFAFNGTDQFVMVPSNPTLDVGAGGGMTMDAWINHANMNQGPIVEYNNGSLRGAHIWLFPDSGQLYANFVDTMNQDHQIFVPNVVFDGLWYHVAVTYDKTTGMAVLYLNGQAIATQNLGIFTPATGPGYDLYIGHRPGSIQFFDGDIDEVEIFNRALTANEINGIYGASVAGKCTVTTATLAKAHNGSFTVGSPASYTVSVTNNGTINLPAITVTDVVPASLVNIMATSAGAACNVTGNSVSCTTNSKIPVGATVPITITGVPIHAVAVSNTANITTSLPGNVGSTLTATDNTTIAKGLPVFSNLSVSPSTINFGTPTVNVSGTLLAGSEGPVDNVNVTINGVTTQIPLDVDTDGSFGGTVNTSTLGVSGSPYTVTFSYPGNADFLPAISDSSQTLTILQDSTTTTLAAVGSLNLIQGLYGTVTATVADSTPGTSGTPTGTVSFFSDATGLLGTAPLVNGVATFSFNVINPPFNFNISSIYSGDSNFTTSSSNSLPVSVTEAICFTPTTDGPVSWYRAENDANDSAGQNDGSTVHDNVTFVPGFVGKAFSFGPTTAPDTNSGITTGDPTALQFGGTGNMSIEGWVNTTHFSGRIADKITPAGSDGYYLDFAPSNDGTVRFNIGTQSLLSTALVPSGLWTHVAATYDGATMTIYINGQAAGTQALVLTPAQFPVNPALPAKLGIDQAGNNAYQGLMDEISFYNQALSASDIQGIYQGSVAGKCITQDVAIFKSHVGPDLVDTNVDNHFVVGLNGVYKLMVLNEGSINAASGISVSDTVPSNYTISSATSTNTNVSCNVTGQQVNCTDSAPLATDDSFTVRITVVPTTAASGVTNTGNLTFAADQNSGNNSSTDTVDVFKGNTAFKNLTDTQAITYGTPSITLSGTLTAGVLSPPVGEAITISIDSKVGVGHVGASTTIQAGGAFSVVVPLVDGGGNPLLDVANSSYSITYSYAGDANFAATTDSNKSLNIQKAQPAFSNLAASTSVSFDTTPITVSGILSTPGVPMPVGQSITITAGSSSVTTTTTDTAGHFTASLATNTLGVAGSPYTIKYNYAATANFKATSDSSKTLTVTASTPSFTNLTASQAITFGTPTVTLSGTLVDSHGVSPPSTQTVSVKINGVTQTVNFSDETGDFTVVFNTAAIPASATPYPITYSFTPIDANFTAANNHATTLTVNKAQLTFVNLQGATVPYSTSTITIKGQLSSNSPALPVGQNVVISFASGGGHSTPAVIGANGKFSAQFTLSTLDNAGTYPVTFAYTDTTGNFASVTDSVDATVVISKINILFKLTPANPMINFGTTSVTITGTVKSGTTGTVLIPSGQAVAITFNGVTQMATIDPVRSTFTSIFTGTGSIPAGSAPITLFYAGDVNFNSVTDSSNAVTVEQVTPVFSNFNGDSIVEGTSTATISGFLKVNGLIPQGNETVTITITGLAPQTATINPTSGRFSAVISGTDSLVTGSYPISFSYAGDNNFTAATGNDTFIVKGIPAFTGLVAAPSINLGANSVTLSGNLAADGGSAPVANQPFTIKIGNLPAQTFMTDGAGHFSVTYTGTSGLAPGNYPIIYTFGGNVLFTNALENTTTLTVCSGICI